MRRTFSLLAKVPSTSCMAESLERGHRAGHRVSRLSPATKHCMPDVCQVAEPSVWHPVTCSDHGLYVALTGKQMKPTRSDVRHCCKRSRFDFSRSLRGLDA